MKTYALDFESYYDKQCSITTLGPRGYFSHPSFDAYLMSIVGDDGTTFCGPPSDFDWSILNGGRILSHNASFDQHLYYFGVENNWWPPIDFAEWHCTADMVAYLGLPRSLKNSSAAVLGISVDKSTRDNMSGKQWSSMTQEFQKEVIEYAIKDSEYCLELWKQLSDKWPERERKISFVNRTAAFRGIPIDQDLLSKSIADINKTLFDTEESIPWVGEKPVLSRIAFNDECRKNGLEPPASLALDSDEANEFLDSNSDKYPWINAVRNYRRINALKRKLESFDKATMDDGRFYGGLMYFGAHTGRFSGSGGNLNLQNLPRGEMFGVDLRSLIAPAKGHRLLAVDLSQIEVRTLCWLANDTDTMAEIAASDDIYEAFAVRFGLWDKSKGSMREMDPKTRHMVKAIVLGCFGPKTKVLTDRGWVDIVRVRDTDKVWDGTQWVHHEGLLHQGVQETITRFGVEATSDHEILTEHGWREWCEVQQSEKDLKSALVMASLPSCRMSEQHEMMAGLDGTHWSNVRAVGVELLTAITCRVGKLLDVIVALKKPPHERLCVGSNMRKLYQIKRIGNDYSTGLVPSITDAIIQMMPDTTTMGVAGFGSMSLGSTIGRNFLLTLSHLMDGINHTFNSIGSITTKVMNRTIFGSLLRCRIRTIDDLLGVCKKESKSLRRKSDVYDLKNCGPNNRFTIKTDFGPIIVHNCGYGCGPEKFSLISKMDLTEAEGAVSLYREKMRKVVQLWRRLNENLGLARDLNDDFSIELPSGRSLNYGKLQAVSQKGRIQYVAMMTKHSKKMPVKLYGGLLSENASQALARDIFCDMLCRIHDAGLKIIFHVHDEVVLEVPEETATVDLQRVIEIMSTPPEWIPDIPLSAEGTILTKYTK